MGSRLELGVVARAHGLRGAVRVHLHNRDSTALESARELVVLHQGAERTLPCRYLGRVSGAPLLELAGIEDREAAEALAGAILLIEREQLPELGEDEYYYDDLVGCRVQDEQGSDLGAVARVFSAGAADVLVVHDGEGGERMIPLVDDWVIEVDPAAQRIRVRGAEQFEPGKS